MGAPIITPIPVRCNVGQKIKTRISIHVYTCKKCGAERFITAESARRSSLCLTCANGSKSHGLASGGKRHPLCGVRCSIISRCQNPNDYAYKNYGARGINVCKEWASDASVFVQWCLENGWMKGLQIDRIDVNGDYSPENCRFVSSTTNNQNRRNNKLTKYDVRAIRMLCWSGVPKASVARIFGVAKVNVGRIMAFESWPDV